MSTCCSPPTTPRLQVARFDPLQAPPLAPRRAPPPPLMAALDIEDDGLRAARVKEVLNVDPSVAMYPFFDHGWEPPLCYAVRQRCGIEVLMLLIEHGADVNATDANGATPAKLLRGLPYDDSHGQTEEMLLAAGAKDVMVKMDRMNKGQSDLDVHGCRKSCFKQFDWEHQASSQSDLGLPEDLCAFLATEEYKDNLTASLPPFDNLQLFAELGA